ncbi:MAG: M14 family metallopeptidase [Defluviitaleaceae bacterium]|nr:M14 family metallopeptidase [Defluviitaleaceae bacterium]
MHLEYNRYYRYHALVEALEDFKRTYPDFTKLYSIGKTYEGRDIWCIELTNQKTGKGEDKPGYYLDGNTHAGEVTGSMACLYTIDWLLKNYGKDPQATRILDRSVIYVIPRICADGAELYLTTPYMLRSSVHEWRYPDYADPDGLRPEDVDGNGEILQMRIRDDLAGDWKVSDQDARLMVRRAPHDYGGKYYRLFCEGIIENYNGITFDLAPARWGIDMNRNYPINWKPPHIQNGAGDTPLSEPESRTITNFLLERKNIAAATYHHTSGGILLRPNCVEGDDKMPPPDLAIYKVLGTIGEEITGYPCQDIFGAFADKNAQWGTFMDLTYEYLGINSFATELWDLMGRSGFKDKGLAALTKLTYKEQEEVQLKLLRWNDEVMNGECFFPWKTFNHPQLGEVEIGGWNPKEGRQNPPVKLLEEECEKAMRFTLMHMETLPQLVIDNVRCEKLGDNMWRITAAIENAGFLPTASTYKAINNRITEPVKAHICGGKVLQGDEEIEIGHLAGRGLALAQGPYGAVSSTGRRKKVEWLVEGAEGSELCIAVKGERAGTVCHTLILRD